MNNDGMIILDIDWVLGAIRKQHEAETGQKVASVSIKLGHIFGEAFETPEYEAAKFVTELKEISIEIIKG